MMKHHLRRTDRKPSVSNRGRSRLFPWLLAVCIATLVLAGSFQATSLQAQNATATPAEETETEEAETEEATPEAAEEEDADDNEGDNEDEESPTATPTPTTAETATETPDATATTSPTRATPTATATADSDAQRLDELLAVQSSRLAYNGEIVAIKRVEIMPETSGLAIEVNVEVGDEVSQGDVLVQLEATELEAAREQAMISLSAAQADLEKLQIGAEPEDIEAATAAVNAAALAYQQVQAGPLEEDIRIADSQLRQAEAAVNVAQAAYNQVRGNPQIAALPQSLELQRATLQFEAAQATYDKTVKGPTDEEIASAYAQLASARASLAALQRGPSDADILSAQAAVRQAETSLYLAQRQLEKAAVQAPIDGVVAVVAATAGTQVGSSNPVVTLLSHDVKVVIAVEEFRLSQLSEGQSAIIRVDAYPDQLIEGVVTGIAPELDPATRTIEVTIEPTSDSADVLMPGMFASVDLLDISDEE